MRHIGWLAAVVPASLALLGALLDLGESRPLRRRPCAGALARPDAAAAVAEKREPRTASAPAAAKSGRDPLPAEAIRAARGSRVSFLLQSLRRFSEPEDLARIRDEVLAWRWDQDPEVQAKAAAILAELDMGWEAAAAHHSDPDVRRALLENPPRARFESEPRLLEWIIEVAVQDPAPDMRAAALAGLPTGLSRSDTGRIALCLSDADPRVVTAALRVLRQAREWDEGVLDRVRALEANPGTDVGVKREVLRVLGRRVTETTSSAFDRRTRAR